MMVKMVGLQVVVVVTGCYFGGSFHFFFLPYCSSVLFLARVRPKNI